MVYNNNQSIPEKKEILKVTNFQEKSSENDSFSVEFNEDENFEGGENQRLYDPLIKPHNHYIPKTYKNSGHQHDIQYDGGQQSDLTSKEDTNSQKTVDYEQEGLVLNYQQSLRRTIGAKSRCSCLRFLFQILILLVALIAASSTNPLIMGLPFMKSEPHKFHCKEHEDTEWHDCDKKYICSNGLNKNQYKPDESDSQFIENWQSQTSMLCESRQRIGLIGAMYFIGILAASTIVPVGLLSDLFGRKWIFVVTLLIVLISVAGFIFARSIEELYVYMFLLGTTFPGRVIVGVNYAQEFQKKSWIEFVQPVNQLISGISLILTALYFQTISKKIIYIEYFIFFLVVYLLLQTLITFPESTRYSYSKEKFDQTKDDLERVAKVNGVQTFNKQNFKFDTQVQLERIKAKALKRDGENLTNDTSGTLKKDGGNEYGITICQFVLNLIILSLLATCFSFSYWLLTFQVQYLGTDIYILFYAQGIVQIIAGQVNLLLYERLGLKTLVLIMQSINIVFSIFMVLIQQKVIKSDNPDEETTLVNVSIPIALFFMSLSIQVGFTAVYQTAFQDERIFPFDKKTTAINIVVLVSKTITIGAPFVNELDEPIPIIVIIGLSALSLIITLFFKSKAQLDLMQIAYKNVEPNLKPKKE